MGSAFVAFFAVASVVAWLGLRFARGGFWRCDQTLQPTPDACDPWPPVCAVIPARNERETIGRAVASLLAQDYPGEFRIVVVDDHSSDGTAAAASGDDRLTVIPGQALPGGWTGKLWAVNGGLEYAERHWPDCRYWLLTDADIEHAPSNLRRLVAKAESERFDLVSLMVRLHCGTVWERLLVPAFIFFFQKLFPFPWVNDHRRPEAAAAGGCLLVRSAALRAAGGVASIRNRLIDDCALAALLKRGGAIWLGLALDTHSHRRYDTLGAFWDMVARTAYAQLSHSFANLVLTIIGMVLLYAVPPVAAIYGIAVADPMVAIAGVLGWGLMASTMGPTLELYRLPTWWGLALPALALLYVLMTADSARRHWLGRGGKWKGRHFDGSEEIAG